MSVIDIGQGNEFQALSSDEWPLNTEDGATLHVIDTGEEYVFHNGGWEQDLRRVFAIRSLD